jgi:hypothetical protein
VVDLTRAGLEPADGMIFIAAHLSRAETLTEWLEPSVSHELNPDHGDCRLAAGGRWIRTSSSARDRLRFDARAWALVAPSAMLVRRSILPSGGYSILLNRQSGPSTKLTQSTRLQTFGGSMTIRPTMRGTGFGRTAVRTGSFNSAPIKIPLP